MGKGKCLVSSLSVLDTLLCNLYVNYISINQVGKGWVASKKKIKKSVSKQNQRAVFNEYVVVSQIFTYFSPNQTKTICT